MGFSADLTAVDAAVAAYFDDVACTAIGYIRLPRAVNGLPEPDETRESFDFFGTIERDPSLSTMTGGGVPQPQDRQSRPVAKLCLTALASAWPWMPRAGDHIVCGDDRYAVAVPPERDGSQRVAIWLNAVNG